MFRFDDASLGLSLINQGAPILSTKLPEYVLEEIANVSNFLKSEVDAGRYTPQLAEGDDGNRVFDLSKRACYIVGESSNSDVNFNIDKIATAYIKEHFNLGTNAIFPTGSMCLHNVVGGGIAIHTDAGPTPGPRPTRVVIAMCYLNDNFEGGDIEFPDHNFRQRPTTGDVVVFPTSYPHLVHALTAGYRHSIQRGYYIADATTGKHTL